MNLNGYNFVSICKIMPERSAEGLIIKFQPQSRYKNRKTIALNKYGAGRFCRFRIPSNINKSGVYIITVNKEYKYVGECEDLSSRYNMGYGQISPRNCFVGGQETNCRINKLILKEACAAKEIRLWFLKTANYKKIEQKLRASLLWPWNRI